MGENLDDHCGLFDRREERQGAAAASSALLSGTRMSQKPHLSNPPLFVQLVLKRNKLSITTASPVDVVYLYNRLTMESYWCDIGQLFCAVFRTDYH